MKVIVHGWNSNGNSAINPLIRDAFLAVQDCNVIVVDWRALANSLYTTAVNGVPSVGQHLGNFLVWLINNAGGNWNNVHLVGFSLGAHVVGNAGRQTGRRPARITGIYTSYSFQSIFLYIVFIGKKTKIYLSYFLRTGPCWTFLGWKL